MACNAIATATAIFRLSPQAATGALAALAASLRAGQQISVLTGQQIPYQFYPAAEEIAVTVASGLSRVWFIYNPTTGSVRASTGEVTQWVKQELSDKMLALAVKALYERGVTDAVNALRTMGNVSKINRTQSGAITLNLSVK